MSEQTKTKIIELIQSSLVPKTELMESQQKVKDLEEMLEKAMTDLQKVKSEYDEQKLTIDIIKAEKETLEAEKKTIRAQVDILLGERESLLARQKSSEAERESFSAMKIVYDAKLNELSLKLKQKTHQYDSLLKSKEADAKDKIFDKPSTGTQTIKEEPNEIGIVNIPTSTSSKENETVAKTGTKRQNVSSEKGDLETPKTKPKRKKVETDSCPPTTRKSTQSKVTFTCGPCVDHWGLRVENKFQGDPNKSDVPDPKQKISTFSSFEDYKNHLREAHFFANHDLKKLYDNPNSKFVCNICDSSFKCQHVYDDHMVIEHAKLQMTNRQFFNLYLFHENSKCLC